MAVTQKIKLDIEKWDSVMRNVILITITVTFKILTVGDFIITGREFEFRDIWVRAGKKYGQAMFL